MENSVLCESNSCARCPVKCHRRATGKVTSKEEALSLLFENAVFRRETEQLPLSDALGRVTAKPVYAALDVPNTADSESDGVAVNHDFAAERIKNGNFHFDEGEYIKVCMGSPLPEGIDVVIPAEKVRFSEQGIELAALPPRGGGVDPAGSRVKSGTMLVSGNHRISPENLGIFRYSGVERIEAWKKPRAAILTVGDDLVEAGTRPAPGQLIESDSIMIAAIIEASGGEADIMPLLPDKQSEIKAALLRVAENYDFIVIIGGAGHGRAQFGDYVVQAVEEAGRLLVQQTAIGPGGKPQFMAIVGDRPVIGIPGPMHAAITQAEQYLPMVLEHYLGVACYECENISVRLGPEFVRGASPGFHPHVRVSWNREEFVATPIRMGDNPECFAYANATLTPEKPSPPGGLTRARLTFGERAQRIKGETAL